MRSGSNSPPTMSPAVLRKRSPTSMELDTVDAGSSADKPTAGRSRSRACLHCRRRKMRCDGAKPACFQCKRAERASECEYDDGTTKTVTQLLYEKLHRLEKRLRELQAQNPNARGSQGGSGRGGGRGTTSSARGSSSSSGAHRATPLGPGPGQAAWSRPGMTHSRSSSTATSLRPLSSGSSVGSHYSSADVTPPSTMSSTMSVPSMGLVHHVEMDYNLQQNIHSQNDFQIGSAYHAAQYGFVGMGMNTSQASHSDSAMPNFAYGPEMIDGTSAVNFSNADLTPQGTKETLLPFDMSQMPSPESSPTSMLSEEPSPALMQYLVECFLPHAQQVGLTPRHPLLAATVTPALLNAFLLWGAHFAPDKSLLDLREVFLRRAVAALPELLQQQSSNSGSPGLVEAVQASTLIATYFFAHGRALEGSYHANTAVGVVLCTGLHATRLSPSRSHPSSPLQQSSTQDDFDGASMNAGGVLGLLPAPRNRLETMERLLAFWNAFVMQRTWSAACGLPSTGSQSAFGALKGTDHGGLAGNQVIITASWPTDYTDDMRRRSYSPPNQSSDRQRQYSPPLAQTAHGNSTIDDFLSGIDVNATNTPLELRAKAAALFEASTRLAEVHDSSSTDGVAYPPGLATLQRTLSLFIKRLPPLPTPLTDVGVLRTSSFSTCTIFTTYSVAHASVIRAHYSLAQQVYSLGIPDLNVSAAAWAGQLSRASNGIEGVYEHLFAYEAVNSQYGISNAGVASESGHMGSSPLAAPPSEGVIASMAVAALDKCVDSSRQIVQVVGSILQDEFSFLEPIVGPCWMLAALILLRELERLDALNSAQTRPGSISTSPEERYKLISQLDVLIGGMRCLGTVFPIADSQAQKISSMLAAHSRQTV